jgi:CRP/FNR family transcriptional regulator
VAPQYVKCDACHLSPICSPVNVGEHAYDFTGKMVQRRHHFKKGSLIFQQGEAATLIYAISAGSIKLTQTVKALDRVIDFRIPGELLDVNALNLGTNTYSAHALEDSYLCEIGKDTLNDIASQVPQVQGRLMTVMSKELNSIQQSALLLHGNVAADEKIAAFILNLAWRFHNSGYSSEHFNLSMTRLDIADFLGLSKETIIRVLKKLQQQGLIVLNGKAIKIPDINLLQQFVGIELI